MFNLSFYKKKIKKILLPINKIIGSFFTELNRTKSQSNKQIPIKKKIILLDSRIESFFDKFKNLRKFNQGKKKFYYLNNKITISIAFLIILFFSYFLIPVFYDEDKIKSLLKNQISNKYGINIIFKDDINYGLFPKPFFYTKNLEIEHKNKVLANSKYVKFYVSSGNFFSFKKMQMKNLIFQNTEFNINSNNIDFFDIALNNSELKNKFIFNNSKLFFRDESEDLLFLSKLKNFSFFYDEINEVQKLISDLEIFNTPFSFNIIKNNSTNKKNIKLSSKKIRMDINTSIEYKNESINGFFNINFLNKENSFSYIIKDKTLSFSSLGEDFRGDLNFKPFYFSSYLNFDYINQKKIFQNESLIIDILDSELLNNSNLNAVINLNIKKIDKFEYLTNFAIRTVLDDGRIFMDDFNAKWNEAVSIKSNEIEFINDQSGKKLIGEILFNFDDVEKFFRYFQIKRNYRNVFKRIGVDFVYDFTQEKLILTNLKIDNKSVRKLNNYLDKHNKENENLLNKVKFKNFIKEFFKIYAG